jgi:hypothetical protein
MNEKPGLEPGFLRAAGGLTGYALLPLPSTCLACHFEVELGLGNKRTPGSSHTIGGLIVSTSNRHDAI